MSQNFKPVKGKNLPLIATSINLELRHADENTWQRFAQLRQGAEQHDSAEMSIMKHGRDSPWTTDLDKSTLYSAPGTMRLEKEPGVTTDKLLQL